MTTDKTVAERIAEGLEEFVENLQRERFTMSMISTLGEEIALRERIANNVTTSTDAASVSATLHGLRIALQIVEQYRDDLRRAIYAAIDERDQWYDGTEDAVSRVSLMGKVEGMRIALDIVERVLYEAEKQEASK